VVGRSTKKEDLEVVAALKSSWLKSGVDQPTEKPAGVDPGSPILVQIQNAL